VSGRKQSPGREKLLESAAVLFAAAGFDGTSTKQLAANAGLSIGALYHHFPTKADAYRAALEWSLSRIAPPAEAGGTASEQLDAQVRWFCSVIAAQTVESQLLRLELLDPHLPMGLTELAPFSHAFARFQRLMIEVAPDSDAEEVVAAIVSLSFGFARLGGLKLVASGFAERTADPAKIAEAVMRIVLR
jgi:AcrR family transcriptional regulator